MIVAISSGQKLGLALVAAAFIAFALASAMLIPRYRPEYPGRFVRLFVLVTVVFFVGMMAAVFVFGKEEEEGGHEAKAATTHAGGTTAQGGGGATGDAAAGKSVFASAGCGSCHTYKPAGSDGTVGPNLDDALKGKNAAFIHESIVDPNEEIAKGYPPNVMPDNFEQTLSAKQIDDLVAFLQQG